MGHDSRASVLELAGPRSALAFYAGRTLGMLGTHSHYRRVDLSRIRRFVFVCSGNICRSPYGHAKAAALGFPSVSCGTTAIDDAPADPSAKRVAATREVDLSKHASSAMSRIELGAADLVIAMEPHHARALEPVAREHGAQITLLGLWGSAPSTMIPDPYGRRDEYFTLVFELIDDALARLMRGVSAAR